MKGEILERGLGFTIRPPASFELDSRFGCVFYIYTPLFLPYIHITLDVSHLEILYAEKTKNECL